MRTKISLIGAGSVIFAKALIADILQMPELKDVTICLMDIDEQRLKVAEIVARKMVRKLESGVRIEITQDQRKAVKDARYVFCTIQVGGYKPATIIDFEIPRKYGLLQTMGDTIGIGGIFRGLRTLPVMISLAEDIARYAAPDCLLLNYTNPMAMNCMGVHRAAGIAHVGLCHSVQGTSRQLASLAGLPYEDVTYLVAGINHMAFFLRFEYQGQDAYPLLFQLIADPAFKAEKVRFEMMRRIGYFVTESSEHQAEYSPYFIHHGPDILEKFDIPIDELLRRCEAIMATWHYSESHLVGPESDIVVPKLSQEYGAFIIRARESNQPVVIYGNVPNNGLITNLPKSCCVEVPCLVNAMGVQPTHIGNLPPQLAALCQTNVNVQELTVEAALSGKREFIYHAAMMDPHTAAQLPLDKIWTMCDELIAAHQAEGLLGEFAPVIRNTGKSYRGTGDRLVARLVPESTLLPNERAVVDLMLEVENPTPEPHRVDFTVIPRLSGNAPVPVSVEVPAGGVAQRNFQMLVEPGDAPRLDIDLRAETERVFCRGVSLSRRVEYFAAEDSPAVARLELAGFPAGEVRFRPTPEGIHVAAHIFDSKASTPKAGQNIWETSCLEVYFAGDFPGALATQILCGPQPGQRSPHVVSTFGTPDDIRHASQSVDKMGYEIEFVLLWSALGVEKAPATLLFHLIASLEALGDAHSGGRTALNGSSAFWKDTSHFAVLKTGLTPVEEAVREEPAVKLAPVSAANLEACAV